MTTEQFIAPFNAQFSWQTQYLATVAEIAHDVVPYLRSINASEADYRLVERMFHPERTISFRVDWQDDAGQIQTNTGYRVQMNSARGPYKGGLRFDATVNLDVLKFLALEQAFKNALTGLPLGASKGGANFDPRGKSPGEIKRFCQAFITELYRHIGAQTDVPAGDIGVGAAEIGWMYGQYKRIANEHTGILTGKGTEFGGSLGRTEATGYGVVYLLRHVLGSIDAQVEGKRIAVSGSGNVALHAAEKLLHEGAVVLTLSERGGYLYAADGFTQEALALIKNTKARKQSLRAIAAEVKAEYVTNGSLWAAVPADVYLPAATQNEIDVADARAIIAHNPLVVIEGANMPVAREAVELVQSTDILFVPGKAANAGGVAVSGLEMSQNAGHQTWTTAKVDQYLELIMKDIFHTMQHHGTQPDGRIDYLRGANIGGFIKLFAAMKGLGW